MTQGGKTLTALRRQIDQPSPMVVFLVYLGWSLALTYPLAQHLFTKIPLGDERAATVPFFNLWILQWNLDQLMHGYPNYFHRQP